MVPVEDRASPVSRHRHCHPLRHTGVDEIPYRAASHIMPQHAHDLSLPARGSPGFVKVLQPGADTASAEVRKQVRHNAAELTRQLLDAFDLLAQQGV